MLCGSFQKIFSPTHFKFCTCICITPNLSTNLSCRKGLAITDKCELRKPTNMWHQVSSICRGKPSQTFSWIIAQSLYLSNDFISSITDASIYHLRTMAKLLYYTTPRRPLNCLSIPLSQLSWIIIILPLFGGHPAAIYSSVTMDLECFCWDFLNSC